MNTVTITGNLVAPAELRYTPAGTAVANFAIANNELVKGESVLQGFFDCTAWKAQAVNVAALSKGAPVVVTGRLEQSRWENEEGQTRTRIRIVAMTVGSSLQFAPRDESAEDDEDTVPEEAPAL